MKDAKISFKISSKDKKALESVVKSLNMTTSQYMYNTVQNVLNNPSNNYIYNRDLCKLMIGHVNTIDCMDDSKVKKQLQKEMEEILCLLSNK